MSLRYGISFFIQEIVISYKQLRINPICVALITLYNEQS